MSDKPKGMQVAIQRARDDAKKGKQVYDCPYKGKAWVTVWISTLQSAQQLDMFDGR